MTLARKALPQASPVHGGRLRGAAVVAIAIAGFAALAFFSLFAGSGSTTAAQVWAVLTGGGDEYTQMIVDTRIPRTIIGAVTGACLAVSGALIQAITRNPLGDPGYLGVTTGASAAVVAATALLGTGVVLSMPAVFDSYRFWVVGSLTGADLDDLWTAGPVALVGLIAAFALTGGLNALGLGDEMAASLGVRVPLVRAAGILAATLLAAAATALTGPIAFLGLAVPHIARAAVGHDLRWQLPACVFAGAGLLVAADMLARVVLRPQELMVGIVTALLGAPLLLAAVRRMDVMRT